MKRICSMLGILAVAVMCSSVTAGEEGKAEAKEVSGAASCCGHHGFLHKLFHRGCCDKVSIEIPVPRLPALPSIGCSPCGAAPCINPLAYLMDRIRAARPCCGHELKLPALGCCGRGIGDHLAGLRCRLHALLPSFGCSRCAGKVEAEKVEPEPAPAPAPAPAPEGEKADSARRDGLLILTPAG